MIPIYSGLGEWGWFVRVPLQASSAVLVPLMYVVVKWRGQSSCAAVMLVVVLMLFKCFGTNH